MTGRYTWIPALLLLAAMGPAGCNREEVEKTRQAMEQARAEKGKLQDELQKARQALGDLEAQYEEIQKKYRKVLKIAVAQKKRMKTLEKQSQELQTAKTDADNKLLAANKQIDALQKDLSDLQKSRAVYLTERDSAAALAARLRQENQQLRAELEKLRRSSAASR